MKVVCGTCSCSYHVHEDDFEQILEVLYGSTVDRQHPVAAHVESGGFDVHRHVARGTVAVARRRRRKLRQPLQPHGEFGSKARRRPQQAAQQPHDVVSDRWRRAGMPVR